MSAKSHILPLLTFRKRQRRTIEREMAFDRWPLRADTDDKQLGASGPRQISSILAEPAKLCEVIEALAWRMRATLIDDISNQHQHTGAEWLPERAGNRGVIARVRPLPPVAAIPLPCGPAAGSQFVTFCECGKSPTAKQIVASPPSSSRRYPRILRVTATDTKPMIIRHVPDGQICCVPEWEAAYERFETPEQEVDKFVRRLTAFGFPSLPKSSRIAEIFCGRGNGLVALERMGFTHLEGVDLSASLLEQYRGPATLHLADCLDLPLDADAYDIVIVQGGLHHLSKLPDDLDRALAQVRRILKPDGRFYVIEPWSTLFLTTVHLIVERPLVRRFYAKGDALAVMTEHERDTYEQWLGQPDLILKTFDQHFERQSVRTRWGKLAYVGKPLH